MNVAFAKCSARSHFLTSLVGVIVIGVAALSPPVFGQEGVEGIWLSP